MTVSGSLVCDISLSDEDRASSTEPSRQANARYYVPEVGRFASPDTIVPDPGNPQSFNRYSYALNSPTNFVDPSGHCAGAPNDPDNSDLDCWAAYGEFQSQFPDLTLDSSLGYDELKLYLLQYTNLDQQSWLAEALLILLNAGSTSRHGAEFIIGNHIDISIREFSRWQQGMGIRWSLEGSIEMRADMTDWDDPVEQWQLPGVVHEAMHLEQGPRVASSKLGELQGWYVQHSSAQELNVDLGFIPTEVVAWGNDPTEANFAAATDAIIDSQPRTYFFWLLPSLPFRGSYQENLARLP